MDITTPEVCDRFSLYLIHRQSGVSGKERKRVGGELAHGASLWVEFSSVVGCFVSLDSLRKRGGPTQPCP